MRGQRVYCSNRGQRGGGANCASDWTDCGHKAKSNMANDRGFNKKGL